MVTLRSTIGIINTMHVIIIGVVVGMSVMTIM